MPELTEYKLNTIILLQWCHGLQVLSSELMIILLMLEFIFAKGIITTGKLLKKYRGSNTMVL